MLDVKTDIFHLQSNREDLESTMQMIHIMLSIMKGKIVIWYAFGKYLSYRFKIWIPIWMEYKEKFIKYQPLHCDRLFLEYIIIDVVYIYIYKLLSFSQKKNIILYLIYTKKRYIYILSIGLDSIKIHITVLKCLSKLPLQRIYLLGCYISCLYV